MPEVDINGVIIEYHSDPINNVTKKRRNIIYQLLSITDTLSTKLMVANFTRNINELCLSKINQTIIKLKGLETGNQTPKV